MLLEEHYRQLLGLGEGWRVERVYLNTKGRQVDIRVEHGGGQEKCPHCKATGDIYDKSPERRCRHLDTMQFATVIHASPPRIDCRCGVVTAEVPWAGRHSRFTLAFERFAVEVLLACGGPGKAASLLGLDWKQAQGIMARAVERGMGRRGEEEMAWAGIDEKAFRHGFHYVSMLTDIEGGRVLDVAEGRCAEDAECLIANALSERQRGMVCGVAMDMSAAYEAAVRKMLPDADIVHDKFHLENILTYFDSFISNAAAEGFNSKIQSIISNARGFRSFQNFRTSILFYCGSLSLYP